MSRFAFLLSISLFFVACGGDAPAEKPATEQPAIEQAEPQATLPSVPLELLERIWKEGTQVDYIFYHYPFTISMNEQPAIQHTVRHISEQPAPLNPNCQAFGRVTYQIDGDIVLEGDFYFTTGCTYYVFYEKQQKKYANYMTDEGITYFNNQIKQAQQLQQQATGQ